METNNNTPATEIWKITLSQFQGRNLVGDANSNSNVCHPYLLVKLKDKIYETQVQEKTNNPSWTESFEFEFLPQGKDFLFVECYDSLAHRNLATKIKMAAGPGAVVHNKANPFLGLIKIDLCSLIEQANNYDKNSFQQKEWFPLGKVSASSGNYRVSGDIQVLIRFDKKTVLAQTSPKEGDNLTIGHCGNIGREEAEKRLTGKPVGTFLMRFSDKAGYHVLSYVRQDHRIGHIGHIKEAEDGKVSVVTGEGNEKFESLRDFINTMKKNRVIFDPVENHTYNKTQ